MLSNAEADEKKAHATVLEHYLNTEHVHMPTELKNLILEHAETHEDMQWDPATAFRCSIPPHDLSAVQCTGRSGTILGKRQFESGSRYYVELRISACKRSIRNDLIGVFGIRETRGPFTSCDVTNIYRKTECVRICVDFSPQALTLVGYRHVGRMYEVKHASDLRPPTEGMAVITPPARLFLQMKQPVDATFQITEVTEVAPCHGRNDGQPPTVAQRCLSFLTSLVPRISPRMS